jgi:competence ComEA-like helix-hairpin-helix protein
MKRNQGSILVGLLWCLVLLSMLVIGILHTSRMDLRLVKNYGDRIQAHYLAVAGIEKAKALLYHEARDRSRTGKNDNSQLYSSPQQFREITFGRGQFQVIHRGRQDEGGGVQYGVSDEESRLNVNTASVNALTNLTGLTSDIAAAIVDWRDEDNAVSPGGAEAEYYASLQPPYRPRNGPFQTLRELLMVRGVTPDLLLGEDTHMNGLLDFTGGGTNEIVPNDNRALDQNAGWVGILTVDSVVENVNASGESRVDMQNANESSIAAVRGFSTDIAKAIIAQRNKNRFNSIIDLLDVVAAQPQDTSASTTATGSNPRNAPGNNANASGPKVISEDLLLSVADDITIDSASEVPGLININTASLDVLACLPGVDRELAQAIISYRQSNNGFANVAWLLKVPGARREVVKQITPLVCTRSETFRILCEGTVRSTGVRQRIQEIVHVGHNEIRTVSYREDDL